MSGWPRTAVTPPSLFVIDRSAWGAARTVVVSVSVLFPGTGSSVVALTVTLFESVPPVGGAMTWRVIEGAGPTASSERVQVTTPSDSPQLQPVPARAREDHSRGKRVRDGHLRRVGGPGVRDGDRVRERLEARDRVR